MKNTKNTKHIFKIFSLSLLLFTFTSNIYALSFAIPPNGATVVGETKTAVVREDEDFSDIAERYDIGYYEVLEANPGVDPDHPAPDTVIIIPTQYIIPPELRDNMIIVNLAEMRLYYRPKDVNRVYIYPVGIGKAGWNTPAGMMKIVEKTVNPKWTVPDSIYKFRKSIGDPVPHVVGPGPDNPLGKYKLRLSNQVYLIHGTNAPEGIGRRTSAGCVRLYPKDIEQLFYMVKKGTKVLIMNQPYKAGWIDGKLYLEAHMPLAEQRKKWGDDITPVTRVVNAAIAKAAAIIKTAAPDKAKTTSNSNKVKIAPQNAPNTQNAQIEVDWDKVKQVAIEHVCVPRVVGSYLDVNADAAEPTPPAPPIAPVDPSAKSAVLPTTLAPMPGKK